MSPMRGKQSSGLGRTAPRSVSRRLPAADGRLAVTRALRSVAEPGRLPSIGVVDVASEQVASEQLVLAGRSLGAMPGPHAPPRAGRGDRSSGTRREGNAGVTPKTRSDALPERTRRSLPTAGATAHRLGALAQGRPRVSIRGTPSAQRWHRQTCDRGRHAAQPPSATQHPPRHGTDRAPAVAPRRAHRAHRGCRRTARLLGHRGVPGAPHLEHGHRTAPGPAASPCSAASPGPRPDPHTPSRSPHPFLRPPDPIPAPIPAPISRPTQTPSPATATHARVSARAQLDAGNPRGSHSSSCGSGNLKQCGEELTLPGGAKFEVYDNYPMSGSCPR